MEEEAHTRRGVGGSRILLCVLFDGVETLRHFFAVATTAKECSIFCGRWTNWAGGGEV